jgi:hypothetical protein
MLLSLPILLHARVTPLLLLRNKPALFIQSSAYNLAEAVKLFLLFLYSITLKPFFRFAFSESRGIAFLSFIQNNKRRDVV